VAVVSLPDIRWGRCDIKTIGLLPNVLAKQSARERGSYEALLVDRDGMVTEGASTNVWMVSQDGQLITRDAGRAILNGITRQALLSLARGIGLEPIERPFSLEEAKAAAEVFLSSTTCFALPVTSIDTGPVGDGRPGSLTMKLRAAYERALGEGARGEGAKK
jgi:D-alanine transaminase